MLHMWFYDPPIRGGVDSMTPLPEGLLRSAVGKTHVLRSGLWWTIPLHIFIDRFGIPMGSQPIKFALARHSGVQVPTYGSTWVVLWLLFCRSAPSAFPDTWSTLKGPFRGVPSHRLYSEIDHISYQNKSVAFYVVLDVEALYSSIPLEDGVNAI